MLYYQWYQEDTDILGGYSTYEEHYHHVHTTIVANESKYCEADVDNIDIDENGPSEHLWSNIVPNTEDNRSYFCKKVASHSQKLHKIIYMTMLIFSIKEYMIVVYCCDLKVLLINKRFLLMNIDSLYEISILNNELLLCIIVDCTKTLHVLAL